MSDDIKDNEHIDYQPAEVKSEDGKLQLTGMYQNWFWTMPRT